MADFYREFPRRADGDPATHSGNFRARISAGATITVQVDDAATVTIGNQTVKLAAPLPHGGTASQSIVYNGPSGEQLIGYVVENYGNTTFLRIRGLGEVLPSRLDVSPTSFKIESAGGCGVFSPIINGNILNKQEEKGGEGTITMTPDVDWILPNTPVGRPPMVFPEATNYLFGVRKNTTGKERTGHITVSSSVAGNSVVITVVQSAGTPDDVAGKGYVYKYDTLSTKLEVMVSGDDVRTVKTEGMTPESQSAFAAQLDSVYNLGAEWCRSTVEAGYYFVFISKPQWEGNVTWKMRLTRTYEDPKDPLNENGLEVEPEEIDVSDRVVELSTNLENRNFVRDGKGIEKITTYKKHEDGFDVIASMQLKDHGGDFFSDAFLIITTPYASATAKLPYYVDPEEQKEHERFFEVFKEITPGVIIIREYLPSTGPIEELPPPPPGEAYDLEVHIPGTLPWSGETFTPVVVKSSGTVTCTSMAAWLSVNPDGSVTAVPNDSENERRGELVFTDGAESVTLATVQGGKPADEEPPPEIVVSPSHVLFTAIGGNVKVNLQPNAAAGAIVFAGNSATWTSAGTNGNIIAEPWTGTEERTASVVFESASGASVEVVIRQTGLPIGVFDAAANPIDEKFPGAFFGAG